MPLQRLGEQVAIPGAAHARPDLFHPAERGTDPMLTGDQLGEAFPRQGPDQDCVFRKAGSELLQRNVADDPARQEGFGTITVNRRFSNPRGRRAAEGFSAAQPLACAKVHSTHQLAVMLGCGLAIDAPPDVAILRLWVYQEDPGYQGRHGRGD